MQGVYSCKLKIGKRQEYEREYENFMGGRHGGNMAYGVNPITGRPGPAPKAAQSGNKQQARQRINVEVRMKRRPHPNSIPCMDCGHVWVPGERRHEYDHHLGYAAEHHYDVESVCTLCHAKRDSQKKHQATCLKGHEFTESNTAYKPSGCRICLQCRRSREAKIKTAEWWRRKRIRMKANKTKVQVG